MSLSLRQEAESAGRCSISSLLCLFVPTSPIHSICVLLTCYYLRPLAGERRVGEYLRVGEHSRVGEEGWRGGFERGVGEYSKVRGDSRFVTSRGGLESIGSLERIRGS